MNTQKAGVRNDENTQKKIFTEQVRLLYANLLLSVPATIICSLIILAGLYPGAVTNSIYYWFLGMMAIAVFRLASYYLYFYQHHNRSNEYYLKLFNIGMVMGAVMWGIADSVLMPNNLIQQMIVMVIIAGITAGGLQTLSSNLFAGMSNLICILAPLCLWAMLQAGFAYMLLGISMCTYLFFMSLAAMRANRMLESSLKLKYENYDLVSSLSDSNKKLYESYKMLETHEHEIILINKMNSMLQTCKNFAEAGEIISFIAKDLFDAFSGAIAMIDPATGKVRTVTQWGKNQGLKLEFDYMDCWALRNNSQYCVNHIDQSLICRHFDSPVKSYICLPLLYKSGNVGILVLHSDQAGAFNEHRMQQLITFNEVIQLSLTNISLRETLYEQSTHDPLTGLFNRRYLDEALSRELKRAVRENSHLCVVMLDFDFFKTINDDYGHDAGDELLRVTGNLLREKFRGFDLACRIGGEEFVLVLVSTDLVTAFKRMQELRETIKHQQIYFNGKQLPQISVSIGIAEAPLQGDNVKDILRAADMALYSAKDAGRDIVVCYSREMRGSSIP